MAWCLNRRSHSYLRYLLSAKPNLSDLSYRPTEPCRVFRLFRLSRLLRLAAILLRIPTQAGH